MGGGVLAEIDGLVSEDRLEILFSELSHVYNVQKEEEEEERVWNLSEQIIHIKNVGNKEEEDRCMI